MSYYLYKEKKYVSVDGKIFPLVKYADSSIRNWEGKRDYHWTIYNIVNMGILADPKEWEEERKAAIEKEFELLQACKWIEDPITLDSTNYCGNSYPGGYKIRNKRAFLSAKKTIPLETLLAQNFGPFAIDLKIYDKSSYKTQNSESFLIRTNEDLIQADARYKEVHDSLSDELGICLGVSGLCI